MVLNPKKSKDLTVGQMAKAWEYCHDQLEIMDGSFEAGIARIGTERFEAMVKKVAETMRELTA